jgi:hypothetical protein
VQNPTYSAATNNTDSDIIVTLTVTATCNGSSPISNSGSTPLTVHPSAHTLSVIASAVPGAVNSGGSSTLGATPTDSHGHGIATWAWDDGGAGGSFDHSNVQNPIYTAPANNTDTDITVTLTVTATCNGPSPISDSDSTSLTVQPAAHTLTVTASAVPSTVASGGSSALSASYTDSWGHGIATWAWNDGGAGGSFSPSANVQSPTYTAPVNASSTDITVTLTVTATCSGPSPISDSDSTTLTVEPEPHEHILSVAASATPETVDSCGITHLSATYSDSLGHHIASWQWDDGGLGGAFLPSANVPDPTYNAPSNFSDENHEVTLTVTATCDGPHPATGSASVTLTVLPIPSDSTVLSTGLPGPLVWGGTGAASVLILNSGTNTWFVSDGYHFGPDHGINRWSVPDMPLTENVEQLYSVRFDFGIVAPPMTTLAYDLPVTPTSAGVVDGLPLDLLFSRHDHPVPGGLIEDGVIISRFPDIQPGTDIQPETPGAWARFYTEECAGRAPAIVVGYPDGTYRPVVRVDRASMAVYMARALKLPLLPYQGIFTDVGRTHWAAPYIEACYRANIVSGYGDNTYRPDVIVNRDAMAVYVARGIWGGMDVPDGPDVGTFPDVPDRDPGPEYWAYDEIEYAVANGIVRGYEDGLYHPTWAVTRDQMSVFIYRGFVQSQDSPVVLGGPAFAATDPGDDDHYGWASLTFGPASHPGYAYIMFDALRLGADLAYGGEWDVKFELRTAARPDIPATGAYTALASFTPDDISAAKSAAALTGDPYLTAVWSIPSALAPGTYLLVVSVEDETGTFYETARRPVFVITVGQS